MPVTSHNEVLPGSLVSIILEADQPTGRQVQGTVEEVLGSDEDPRGVKVHLSDGRVGRVQEVVIAGSASQYRPQQHNAHVPDPQNWQAHTTFPGGGNPPSNPQHTSVPDPQNWQAHTSFPSGRPSSHEQHSSNYSVPDPGSWQAHTSFPSGHSSAYAPPHQSQHANSRLSQAPLLDDAPNIPPEERSEQVEYLQSYESSKPVSQDDQNQATLQREFPDIDSSLIAAIYGDSKSLGETRELLQELKD